MAIAARQPNASSDGYVLLPLPGAARHWQLKPALFAFTSVVSCAGAFLESSAPPLLPPSPATICLLHTHPLSSTLPGRKSSHFWSTYYVCKGLINPHYLSSSLHTPIHLFVSASIQLSLSVLFSVFSVTKLGASAFLEMYCLETYLEIVYTIVLTPYIITEVPGTKYFLASFNPKCSFDQ